jgi:hypothetical protein
MRYNSRMLSQRFSRRQLLLGLAALGVAPAVAAEPALPAGSARYMVELLVFRQLGSPPAVVPAPALTVTASLPGRVIALPDADWQLASVESGLARGGFTLLAHTAWAAIVPPNGRTTAHLEDVLPPAVPLAGSVAVQRGQYLFLGLEIDYRPAGAADGTVYSLREKRRVKFNERHYFDTTAIGAIATVSIPHGSGENG